METNPETYLSGEISGPILVPEENKRPLLDHLEELRLRLLRSLLWVGLGSIFCFSKAPVILFVLLQPVGRVVFLSPAEPFLVTLKIAILGGLFLGFPLVAWEAWSFLRPAAFPYERRLFFFYLPLSVALFFCGAWFGWRVLLPTGLTFLLRFGSDLLVPMLSVGSVLGFAGWLIMASALIFEMPIVILFLTWRKIISPASLLKHWRVALVVTLVVAAALTPTPDVVTQLLLAGPMMGLYLLSVVLAYALAR